MHAMTRPAPPSTNKHAALVAQACRRIEAAEQPPSLDDLAKDAGLSPFHFHRVFKAATGLTPKAYATAHRANAVRASLAGGKASVTAAIFDAGFNANSRFYEHADAMLGMKPTQYRAGGVDVPLSPVIGGTGLATVLLAPFGGYALNLSAITAAIVMSPEAHEDPARRWLAAVAAGLFYGVVGLLGAAVVGVFAAFPKALVLAVAALALLSSIGNGLSAALRDARIKLILAVREVLRNGLGLLGVSAPEAM